MANELKTIQQMASMDRIRLSYHARVERMPERGAQYADIKSGLISATSAVWQPEHQSWKCDGGEDTDGDKITVCVVIEDNLVVVTLF